MGDSKSWHIGEHTVRHLGWGTYSIESTWCHQIFCYSGGSLVGEIDFYPKGNVPLTQWPDDGPFKLNYEVDRYQAVIETLRNERFVYVGFSREKFSLAGNIFASVDGWVESSIYGLDAQS